MAQDSAFNPRLGSFTSGVDGSSEGGRINTMRLPNSLTLYGVALVNQLKSYGYRGKLNYWPELVNGTWCLHVEYEGDAPSGVPELWHGHRVIASQKPAEPAAAPPK